MANFNIGRINAAFLIGLFAEIEEGFESIRPIRKQCILEYKQEFSYWVLQRTSAIELCIKNGFDARSLMEQGELQYLRNKDRAKPSIASLLH